jgi:signal transduction histidine kinase
MTPARTSGAVQDRRSRQQLLIGGVLLLALAGSVIAGWLTGQGRLVTVLPYSAAMPFNAALVFAVAGVALLAIRSGRSRLAFATALVVACFGVLSLLQHTADLLPQLDTLFFTPAGSLADAVAARASPNLALTVFLAGAGLTALLFRSNPVARFGAVQLGASAASIALVDLLAYLSVADGHGLFSIVPQMAIHSAAAMAVLGVVLTTTGWRATVEGEERRQNSVPLVVGLMVTVAAIMLAQVARANDRQRMRDAVQVAAQTVAERIERGLHQRVMSLEGLARIWPGVRADARARAAESALQPLPGAGALGWIGPDGDRRWLVNGGQDGELGHDGSWPDRALLDSIAQARIPRLFLVSTPALPVIAVLAPMEGGGGTTEFLWLVTGAQPWLDATLRGVASPYDVTIRDGEQALYARATPGARGTRVWAQRAETAVRSIRWEVQAWPTESTLAALRSVLPIVVLTSGTLLGVLLGLSASLLRAADLRALELTAARDQVAAEMHERIAAQEALRQSEEQLRQAQRLEAVRRLSGGIAHDFENILGTIRGSTRALLHQAPFTGLAREALEQIDRAASRGALLTTRLLSFSQRQVLQPETVRLGDVVAGVREELGPLLGPAVHLTIERKPGDDSVSVDPQWMAQVVLDLAFDAREVMPLGGSLAIRTMPADETIRRFYGLASAAGLGAVLELEYADRGMGDGGGGRLFEPFFSASQAGRSGGLAISSVYGIVKQSGGEIVTRTTKDGGTRLGVFLPSTRPPARPADGSRLGGLTVMLVDGDAESLALSRQVLSDAGCVLVEGGTAEEALARLDERGAVPDLLVSAIILPGMSGIELASRLRRQRAEIAVLFVSEYTSDAMQQSGLASLDAGLLQKPFTAEELVGRLAALVASPA